MPNWVSDAEVDEVSTVDLPAHQNALFVLAKRATQEETTVGDYFDAEGQPVDITELSVGDWFQNDAGQAYQWTDAEGGARTAEGQEVVFGYGDDEDQADEDVYDGERELAMAGVTKSAFAKKAKKDGDDLFASLSKSLEDAIADEGARTQIAKAISDMGVRLAQSEQRASSAETIAKAAQEREEVREFVELAKGYEGLPIGADELGPVLHRMTKKLSYEDCALIAKCLEHTGDIFKSYGIDAGVEVDDPFEQVEAYMQEHASDALQAFGKGLAPTEGQAATGQRQRLSKEGAVTAFFDQNPREYSALKRTRR